MPRNVLIVEDDWLIADHHAGILRNAEYQVVGPCPSVEAALAAIDGNHVDAAVLDVDLRVERSYPVAQRLQRLGIPFLFISGHDATDVPVGMKPTDVLSKPVDSSRLITAVRGLFLFNPGFV